MSLDLMLCLNPVLKCLIILKNLVSTVKLCSGLHSMSQCDNYKSLSDHQVRCVNLKMCKLCTSLKLNSSSCPGKDDKLPFHCF